jgi:hypothetical protein
MKNLFEIDWEIKEVQSYIDCYDSEVLLESDEYLATGALSCGEIVDIYDIEIKN